MKDILFFNQFENRFFVFLVFFSLLWVLLYWPLFLSSPLTAEKAFFLFDSFVSVHWRSNGKVSCSIVVISGANGHTI